MIEHAWAQPELPARSANDWKKEWDKTIEGAKREGRVHVYIGGWGAVLDAGEFQRAYPFIKVTSVMGRGGEIAKRILAERAALMESRLLPGHRPGSSTGSAR